MERKRVRIILGIIVFLIGLSPLLVGAVNFLVGLVIWIVAAVLLLWFTIYPPSNEKRKAAAQNLTLMFTTLSLAITIFDLLIRALNPLVIYHRPEEHYLRYYPRMPLVVRYRPNLNFHGRAQGELSAIAGNPDYAVIREITLQTDAYGFRNADADPDNIDLIILGDSFGLGMSTTEAATWSNLLRDEYGLSIYDLAAPASSPWRQYANLGMEIDRLDTREDTILLWLIFTGNDLVEEYEDYYEIDQLPYQNGFSAFVTSWRTFILYSPIGITTERMNIAATLSEEQAKPVTVKTFLDGKPLLFSNLYVEQQELSAEEVYRHENYPALEKSIAAGVQLARAKGLTPVIALVPTKGEVYKWVLNDDEPWSSPPDPSGFSQVIAEISEKNNVCYLDLKPHLIEESKRVYEETGDLVYWRDDTHWSESGNAVMAQWFYESICWDMDNDTPCCHVP